MVDDAPSKDDRGEELHGDGGKDDVEGPACPRTGGDHCGTESEVQGDDEHADGNQGGCPAVRSVPIPAGFIVGSR
jgi:hypothetical protein